MKISDHTIYASTKIDRHDKTSALSVPSVVETYQYGYRVNIYSGSESAWTLEKQTTFTYDGWNLIEEQTPSGFDISLTNSAFTQFRTSNYVWGLDLSQTIQGAGGVSGLLSLDKGTATYYYTYIADKRNDEGVKTSNGNVSELIDTAGVVVTHYEYSPFGKLTKEILNSQFVINNSFKFSTKYLDNETQLYYYGLRYYNPENGRWINRDPIQEMGGENLYSFVRNPVSQWDLLGLLKVDMMSKVMHSVYGDWALQVSIAETFHSTNKRYSPHAVQMMKHCVWSELLQPGKLVGLIATEVIDTLLNKYSSIYKKLKELQSYYDSIKKLDELKLSEQMEDKILEKYGASLADSEVLKKELLRVAEFLQKIKKKQAAIVKKATDSDHLYGSVRGTKGAYNWKSICGCSWTLNRLTNKGTFKIFANYKLKKSNGDQCYHADSIATGTIKVDKSFGAVKSDASKLLDGKNRDKP